MSRPGLDRIISITTRTQTTMATEKKTPAPKAEAPAAKAPAKKAAATGFMKPLKPSAALAAVVGKKALPRTEVTKKVWEYIKEHKLQDAEDRRLIHADDKLKAVFGKSPVTMFEMTKLFNEHLK